MPHLLAVRFNGELGFRAVFFLNLSSDGIWTHDKHRSDRENHAASGNTSIVTSETAAIEDLFRAIERVYQNLRSLFKNQETQ